MTAPPTPFDVAANLATTILTININAKYPGTINPDDADHYQTALREARERSALDQHAGTPLVENLLHVMYRLAEFSAARGVEPAPELVRAFAHELAKDVA